MRAEVPGSQPLVSCLVGQSEEPVPTNRSTFEVPGLLSRPLYAVLFRQGLTFLWFEGGNWTVVATMGRGMGQM